MTTLTDRNSKPMAFLYNNKILDKKTMQVIGVTLGDVVFGESGELKGKIFDKILYAISGDIVAMEAELQEVPAFDPIEVLFQGWKILEKIKDHSVPWINSQKNWLPIDLNDFLRSDGAAIRLLKPEKKLSNNKFSF